MAEELRRESETFNMFYDSQYVCPIVYSFFKLFLDFQCSTPLSNVRNKLEHRRGMLVAVLIQLDSPTRPKVICLQLFNFIKYFNII